MPARTAGEKPRTAPRPPARVLAQARSRNTRRRIVEGAISVLADHGVAGLTHRCVARAARVSLASTTYHFHTKSDILAAVSQAVFDDDPLLPRSSGVAGTTSPPDGFGRDRVVASLSRAAGASRRLAACWSEMVLDAPRHAESLALAQRWFAAADAGWRGSAGGGELCARSCGDVAVGLLMMVLALGLSEGDVRAVLDQGADPLERWRRGGGPFRPAEQGAITEKSLRTREAVIAATLDELVTRGQIAIGLKTMARKAGLSPTGAFYHFPTGASLLAAAQRRLFENAKARYRAVAAPGLGGAGLAELIDRTTVIFLREATEYARESLTNYNVWIEAGRQPALQPMVWSAIADQHLAWERILRPFSSSLRPVDPLLAQALFTGKLIRIVTTGSRTEDLARVRVEFAHDLERIAARDFWL